VSKRSTLTLRDRPVSAVASASSGSLVIHGENLVVATSDRVELIDLTDRVMDFVRPCAIREGQVSLWSMHTTCALFVNESQPALLADIQDYLERLAPREGMYRHNDPAYSDCDRANTDSHLRAMILGHSLALQISGGEVVLGQWQRVLMGELDGPRARTIRVQVMGIR
jgi:secondary thiamine-phosphate synthase enzyme